MGRVLGQVGLEQRTYELDVKVSDVFLVDDPDVGDEGEDFGVDGRDVGRQARAAGERGGPELGDLLGEGRELVLDGGRCLDLLLVCSEGRRGGASVSRRTWARRKLRPHDAEAAGRGLGYPVQSRGRIFDAWSVRPRPPSPSAGRDRSFRTHTCTSTRGWFPRSRGQGGPERSPRETQGDTAHWGGGGRLTCVVVELGKLVEEGIKLGREVLSERLGEQSDALGNL